MKSIIMAGGSGTRLWPLSREQYPKQFLKIDSAHSLFQDTYIRALKLCNPEDIAVVTNKNYEFLVKNQIEEIGQSVYENRILCEPCGRNTLPAIIWGTKVLSESGDCHIIAFPSDHLLSDEAIGVFKEADEKLAGKHIVTFGIVPDCPNTGYGYIRAGKPLEFGFEVDEFKEKPDTATAEKYVRAGYLWNSGIVLFSSSLLMSEVKKYQPEMYRGFTKTDKNVVIDYNALESLSIDYGLLEKTDCAAVAALDCKWSDLGSFKSIYDVKAHDDCGNAGNAEFLDSKNNLVLADKRKTAIIGVNNTAVIDSGDALLICNMDRSESVKEIVKRYQTKKDDVVKYHLTVNRPWGSYTVLEEHQFFKIKRVSVKCGSILSLQKHHHRSEHWIVVCGSADVIIGSESKTLTQGQSTFVPAGVIHRLENKGKIPLEVIEVQIGEYLGEDDIERYEDVYGREISK